MNSRYVYMDNLRALLMVLGVLLHTCLVFSESRHWIISYSESLSWASDVDIAIHLFRMPLFFMISGFFAFLLMQKQTVKHFCLTKCIRIGIPFLSVLLLINYPQIYLLNVTSLNVENSGLKEVDNVTSHLWFLINLLVYFLLYSGLHFLFVFIKRPKNLRKSILFILLVLLLAPFLYLFILALNKVGVPIYKGIPIVGSIYGVMSYFDYFLIGAMFALLSHQTFIQVLKSKLSIVVFLPLLLISTIPYWFENVVNYITLPYIEHIQAIFVSLLIWLVATKVLNSESSFMRGLSRASYSIYLFHHGLIILFVLALNMLNNSFSWHINVYLAFFLVMGLTIMTTLAIHFLLITKNAKLKLLFNGK